MARSRLISKVSVRLLEWAAIIALNTPELTLIHLDIDRPPPNLVSGRLLVDNTLVLGTTSSLFAGEVDECTGGRDNGTLIANGILVELRNRRIALQLDSVHVETGLGEVLQIPANHLRFRLLKKKK